VCRFQAFQTPMRSAQAVTAAALLHLQELHQQQQQQTLGQSTLELPLGPLRAHIHTAKAQQQLAAAAAAAVVHTALAAPVQQRNRRLQQVQQQQNSSTPRTIWQSSLGRCSAAVWRHRQLRLLPAVVVIPAVRLSRWRLRSCGARSRASQRARQRTCERASKRCRSKLRWQRLVHSQRSPLTGRRA
jgi:hypothetical protein